MLIGKLKNRKATVVSETIIKHLEDYPFKLLTLDNGLEFAAHEKVSEAIGGEVYFAHPFSSWERGVNENTNGLIRQFFPKGTDLSNIPVEEVLRMQHLLNRRPRKTMGYKTPYEIMEKEGVALAT